jgi:hypothetical protein
MYLADIVKELEKKVPGFGGENGLEYTLLGSIMVNSRESLFCTGSELLPSGDKKHTYKKSPVLSILFEGHLCYISGNNSGKIRYAPDHGNRAETMRDAIISLAKGLSAEKGYEFSYDYREDKMTIRVKNPGNIKKEVKRIEKFFGSPSRQEFAVSSKKRLE